jgi:hypothetical protein
MLEQKTVKIFTMEQQFPCGPKSSCCGPIGQTEEELKLLKEAIEKVGVGVETYDIKKVKNLEAHPQVFKLFSTFGPQAIPVITVGDEVVCIGQAEIGEIISAINSKL